MKKSGSSRRRRIDGLYPYEYNRDVDTSKPIVWVGSSRKDLQAAPEDVRWVIGHALRFA